jgi:CRISPR-associated protein Csm3
VANQTIQLQGRVFLRFKIETVTGLHIGGSDTGIEIGGVDKTVIREPLTHRPYIPGSSLRGKMRSLTEKYEGLKQNQKIGQGYIHSCGGDARSPEEKRQAAREYRACDLCQVYGVPGERDFATPTRLIVRDVHLSDQEAARIAAIRTELPFTEVKTEVSIDRVTSAANPRQIERVPAGVAFGPAEMVYSIYGGDGFDPRQDIARFATVVRGLQFLEDDYLGGSGSRGAGKVRLAGIRVGVKSRRDYGPEPRPIGAFERLADLAANLDGVIGDIGQALVA